MADPEQQVPKRISAPGTSKLAPGLHIVATPIGNRGDLAPRALATLADADVALCEDTRVTGALLRALGVRRRLTSYHEHNAARVRPRIEERLRAGDSVALASDAGTPLVSDPGFRLVEAAIAAGVEVFAVPGPSAALAALTVSGLPTDRFFFQGFLPARPGARERVVAEIAAVPATLVLFESPRRLAETLAVLAKALGPRPAAVARELTKRFEEVRRGTLAALAADFAGTVPKGEIVIVVGPPEGDRAAQAVDVEAALATALAEAPPSEAARRVAALTGRPRRELYRMALALKAR